MSGFKVAELKSISFLLRGEEVFFPGRDQDNYATVESKGKVDEGELYVTNKRIIFVSRSVRRLFRRTLSRSLWFRYISNIEVKGSWIWKYILITYGAGDMPREIKIKTKRLDEVYKLLLYLISGRINRKI